MKKSIVFLFILASILSACQSPSGDTPQVTVTSEVTVTLPPASPTLEATSTPEPTPTSEPQGFSLEDLASMSDEDKVAAAPTMEEARERIPAWVAWTIESQEVFGERSVVYYDADGRQRAAYDLLTGTMYDGVSIYKYDKEMPPLTVFFMNDSEALKEIPEKYLIKGQEERLGEAMFAVLAINWAYPSMVNKEMLENNSKYGLSSVEAQWDYYNETIKPAFVKALLDGSALDKGIMVEGKKITGDLPTFVVMRGRDDNQPRYTGDNLAPWVKVNYDIGGNVFTVLMYPPSEVYRERVPITLGGEFSHLKGIVADGVGGIGGRGYDEDFAKIITIILLDGKQITTDLDDSQHGAVEKKWRLPTVYSGLPDGFYEQGIDE